MAQAALHVNNDNEAPFVAFEATDAQAPVRCFKGCADLGFDDSILALCSIGRRPENRPDIDRLPDKDDANSLIRFIKKELAHLKQKPAVAELIRRCGLTDTDLCALMSIKLEYPFPLYRWLNAWLQGQRCDTLMRNNIGPLFTLVYRAMEKLPKVRVRAARAVIVNDIPALQRTFENYEERLKPGKELSFWSNASFSTKDDVVNREEFVGSTHEPAIVYTCGELEGVDMEPFKPRGLDAEYEVLPLCPAVFRVVSSVKVGAKLVVTLSQDLNEHAGQAYVVPSTDNLCLPPPPPSFDSSSALEAPELPELGPIPRLQGTTTVPLDDIASPPNSSATRPAVAAASTDVLHRQDSLLSSNSGSMSGHSTNSFSFGGPCAPLPLPNPSLLGDRSSSALPHCPSPGLSLMQNQTAAVSSFSFPQQPGCFLSPRSTAVVAELRDRNRYPYSDALATTLISTGATYRAAAIALIGKRCSDGWWALGRTLHGVERVTVGTRHVSQRDCFLEALALNPRNSDAWNSLGTTIGASEFISVNGRSVAQRACFVEAVTHGARHSNAWVNLGSTIGPTEVVMVNGRQMNKRDCFIEAVTHDVKNSAAWRNLSGAMGGNERVCVNGEYLTKTDCLLRSGGH